MANSIGITPTAAQLTARQQLAENRQAFRNRKRDTRRKVVAGAVALSHAKHDPAFRGLFRGILQQHVTKPLDRDLFADLLDG